MTGEAKTLDVTDGKQFTTVEVCDVGVQAAQDEAELPQQISQRIGDLSNMSPQQRRALLANELSVDLDAVESYIRDREERAAIAAKGELKLIDMFYKITTLTRTTCTRHVVASTGLRATTVSRCARCTS